MLGGIELVNFGVENIESIGVPESAHEFALTLNNSLAVEAVGQPRSGVCVEIPADSVCTVGCKSVKRVNGVAL